MTVNRDQQPDKLYVRFCCHLSPDVSSFHLFVLSFNFGQESVAYKTKPKKKTSAVYLIEALKIKKRPYFPLRHMFLKESVTLSK